MPRFRLSLPEANRDNPSPCPNSDLAAPGRENDNRRKQCLISSLRRFQRTEASGLGSGKPRDGRHRRIPLPHTEQLARSEWTYAAPRAVPDSASCPFGAREFGMPHTMRAVAPKRNFVGSRRQKVSARERISTGFSDCGNGALNSSLEPNSLLKKIFIII